MNVTQSAPATPAPAATILIVRDGAAGLEVFMVKRHHQIRSNPPITVMPWLEHTPEGTRLRIRDDAGYTQTSALLRDAV